MGHPGQGSRRLRAVCWLGSVRQGLLFWVPVRLPSGVVLAGLVNAALQFTGASGGGATAASWQAAKEQGAAGDGSSGS